MTAAEIEALVERVSAASSSPETAHGLEDRLYRRVIAAIASGHPDPVGLARAAARLPSVRFPRWRA